VLTPLPACADPVADLLRADRLPSAGYHQASQVHDTLMDMIDREADGSDSLEVRMEGRGSAGAATAASLEQAVIPICC
jgi:hypothetical protein